MKSYYKITLEKISSWPDKDTSEKTAFKWFFKIRIPQLGGDVYSKDLGSIKKTL